MSVEGIVEYWQGEVQAQEGFAVNEPPVESCRSCGLYATACTPMIPVTVDQRAHINGRDPKGFPVVMVVGPKPQEADDRAGSSLTRESFTGDMLLDYLDLLEARWVYVPLIRCYTPGKVLKKHLDACKGFLAREIERWDPQAILTLGKDPFEVLWPEDMGKPPSLFKARTMPVRLASGRWLLGGYDPISHKHYLESEGKRGQDLATEYPMTFGLLDQLLSGTYHPESLEWSRIRTQEEFDRMVSSFQARGVDTLCIDMEDDTFCAHDNQWRPYKVGSSGLPQKYTRWHQQNRLLDFGVSALVGRDEKGLVVAENYAVNVDLLRGRPGEVNFNVHRLLYGRTLVGWNIKVEVQDVWLFTGYDMVDPDNGNTLVDGMIMRSLRDQSLVHNGLKPTAQELFGTRDWSHKIWQELDEAKKSNPWGTASMGDINPLTREEYNIGDVYWNLRLVYEKLTVNPQYPDLAYRELVDGLPFVCRMERNGLPFRPDVAHAVLGVYEEAIRKHRAALEGIPEFQEACRKSGITPAEWGPKKKKFWEAFLDLFGLKGQVSRTPTGLLTQDADTVRGFAGEGDEAGVGCVPWAQKNYVQKVFTLWHRVTRYQDDANKYRYYLDYVVPTGITPGLPAAPNYGVIHHDYYMVKAELESLGNNTNTLAFSGAKSGRFSRTPPQNANNDPIFLSPYEIAPGWLLVEFDYSQAELVWIARNCQDALLQEWIRAGADLHLRKGARLFVYRTRRPEADFWAWRSEADCKVMGGASPEQKPWRQMGKTDNFAFAFLQEPETIAHGLGITLEEAYEIGRASDEMHPNIRARKIETYEALNSGRMVQSHLLGRKRSCPLWMQSRMDGETFFSWDREIRKKRNTQNLDLFRSLWNTIIAQADSSDMTFIQGKRLDRKIQGGLLRADLVKPVEFVHDAIKFAIRADYLDTAAPVITREMMDFSEFLVQFDLPIQIGVKAGRSFAKMEKVRL